MDRSSNKLNFYPERRRHNHSQSNQDQTETSRFFEHSKANVEEQKLSPKGTDKTGQADHDQEGRRRSRQTVLSFNSSGRLSGSKRTLVNPIPRSDPCRQDLVEVAKETISLLPGLLATRPDVGKEGHFFKDNDVAPVSPNFGPKLPKIKVGIVNADTIDAAISLPTSTKPACILNMANAEYAGGGFKYGARAQEESICYRSSLFFTLKLRHYPIPEEAAIYSPRVLVFRKSMADGNDLMDLQDPSTLPVISVVSAAAICQPRLKKLPSGQETYASSRERELMKQKMRTILRVCTRNRHRNVVLGAFGCGAFGNPPEEVAVMWKSVLQEGEFQGGWWENLIFAVLDNAGSGNFPIFQRALEGLSI